MDSSIKNDQSVSISNDLKFLFMVVLSKGLIHCSYSLFIGFH